MARTLLAPAPALAIVALATGCYAAHDLAGTGAICGSAAEPAGWPCESEPTSSDLPLGVCALEDGSLMAFADSTRGIACAATEAGDAFELVSIECAPESARRRVVAGCGEAASSATFRLWPSRPPLLSVSFDLSRGPCAIADVRIQDPGEPWRPFVEATELCGDPYAWCGSPIVLALREPGGDACGGGGLYTHRCAATVEDGRIVLRAEGARAARGHCTGTEGDRVATCVVPPLPAGRHEVVDGEGRALGTIEIPTAAPSGDLEPTCSRLP